MHPGGQETGGDTTEGAGWLDRLLATPPRTYARWFLIAGLAAGCIFAIGTFALLAFVFPDLPLNTGGALAFAGRTFLGIAAPCLLLALVFLLLDKMRTAKGEFWSPFAAPAVRDIYAHLTPDEKIRIRRMSAPTALLPVAGMAAVSCLMEFAPRYVIPAVVVLFMLAGLVGWAWGKKTRRFLCSTEYATERGIKPEDIKFCAPWRR